MSGKGSKPRPFAVSQDEYADRFDAIFGKRQMGLGRAVEASGSNPDQVGSTPTAPATYQHVRTLVDGFVGFPDGVYIDNETGAQVTEEWWPGDKITTKEQSA